MTELLCDSLQTPLGRVRICAHAERDENVLFVDFADKPERMERLLSRRFGAGKFSLADAPLAATAHLREYFDGDVEALEQVAVSPSGTAFQTQIWRGLRAIPAGETLSYGAFAAQLGRPRAARAVGMGCNLNPIGIVIPCHRVVGAGGALTGYAGGLDRKQWLLDHERAAIARAEFGRAPAA